MSSKLDFRTALLLTVPPLLWAGNAIVGRLVNGMVPPITLNFIRWLGALIILLPLAGWLLKPGSVLWASWKRFALLGLLGVGCYNALQYLALKTTTPLNVTLVAGSMPVFMLMIGAMFFGQGISARQVGGAVLSIAGVLVVLCGGDVQVLMQLRLVPGDVYILLATFAFGFYSWLIVRPGDPPEIRDSWSAFLMAQIVFGVGWSGLFAAGEIAAGHDHFEWGWPLAAALGYIVVFPAVIAYRCWGLGVQRAGPNVAAFFSNLTPLFAAVMSAAFLGEPPRLFHAIAFVLIVGGIVMSSRRMGQ